jgi:hypothetical protein
VRKEILDHGRCMDVCSNKQLSGQPLTVQSQQMYSSRLQWRGVSRGLTPTVQSQLVHCSRLQWRGVSRCQPLTVQSQLVHSSRLQWRDVTMSVPDSTVPAGAQ